MEKILINRLQTFMTAKGEGLKVSFNGDRAASVAPWLLEVANYIKSIGVGGTVSVDIKSDGQYSNILKVDMTSGERGELTPENQPKPEKVTDDGEMGLGIRDEIIIAQVIMKEANNMAVVRVAPNSTPEEYGVFLANAVSQLVPAYKLALYNLRV